MFGKKIIINYMKDTPNVIDNETIEKLNNKSDNDSFDNTVTEIETIKDKAIDDVARFKTDGYVSTITLSNQCVSRSREFFDKNIIRNAKEHTPNVIDIEPIRKSKLYTINNDCALMKIIAANHNHTSLPSTKTFIHEHHYRISKNSIVIMEISDYTKTDLYK